MTLRGNALLSIAGAWLLGSVAAAMNHDIWWPGIAAISTAGAVAALLYKDARYIIAGALLACLFGAGGYSYTQQRPAQEPAGIAVHNDGDQVRFRAMVDDAPELAERSQRIRLEVRELYGPDGWEDASGGVMLRAPQYPRYAYGDVLEVSGELETPPVFPDFDYREYLLFRGVQSVAAYADVTVIDTGEGAWWKAALINARQKVGDALTRVLPEPQAALAAGIFANQRTSIPDDLAADMNATGTSHLVAVSGQNVAIIAAMTISSLAWLLGRRMAAIVALFAIAGYVLMTGVTPSVIRAGIMGSLFVVATMAGRPSSAATAIALAAAIMVGHNPLVLHDVSFQLSFAAVAGLIYLAQPFEQLAVGLTRLAGWEPLDNPVLTWLTESLSVTMAAIVFTLPITAVHFDRISLVAPIANLPLVPMFPLILVGAGLTAGASLLWQPMGEFVAPVSWLLLTYMVETVRFFAALPLASVSIDGFGRGHAVVAYALIGGLTFWLTRMPRIDAPVARRRQLVRPAWIAAGGLAIAAAFAWNGVLAEDDARLRVNVLDVGQGDAILIETPDGRHALIDGGASSMLLAQRLGEALPFWQRSLELVVVTHPDADHLGGLLGALERYDVKQVMASLFAEESNLIDEWRQLIEKHGVPYSEVTAGDTVNLGSGAMLHVLWPPVNAGTVPGESSNNSSIVMRLTWGDVAVLFTGDIEEDAEMALLQSGANLEADVLKVAHHGSATSSSEAFMEAVDAELAVISAGVDNAYGHPVPEVVRRLSEDATVLRTDQRGTITLSTDGRRVWVETDR